MRRNLTFIMYESNRSLTFLNFASQTEDELAKRFNAEVLRLSKNIAHIRKNI